MLAVSYSRGIEDAWARVATFIPKLVAFLIILVIGLVVAKIITKAVAALLQRVGFDKLVERGGIKKALESSKMDASDILAKIVYYVIALFVLEMAFGVFGHNAISDLLTRAVAFLPKVFVAVLIVVLAAAAAAAVKEIIKVALGGLSYGQALSNVASITIITIGAFMALDELAVAPRIVSAAFYAMLAIVAGSAIVAIGGSGIQPLRQYWERSLARIEEESHNMKNESQGAGDRIKGRAQELKGQAQAQVSDGDRTQALPPIAPASDRPLRAR
ncbi:MAG: hypothetical protein NVS3B12_00040 [Acidimicrobiales bacterium]